jgi:MFS family permease
MATKDLAPAAPLTEAAPATRVRYGVLAFLCTLTFVLYLDRVCIGKAASFIEDELEISHTDMGLVFGIFTVAYCLFEVPTGHWGDRYGSRGVLTRIVLWWSLFTALTGAATGLWVLLGIRFLFGAGEAGALPNVARVVARWFPLQSRGRIQGTVITAALLGGAFSPAVAAYLIDLVGWRWTFAIFGALGVVWAAAFYAWYRDDPATHPAVNDAERRLLEADPSAPPEAHPPIPWRLVLTSGNVWLMGSVMSCGSFTTYLQLYWFPNYLEKGHGVGNIAAGNLASLVLFGGAVGSVLGGLLNDWLVRLTGERRWSRSGVGGSVFLVAAGAVLACIHSQSVLAVSLWMTLACLALHAHVAAWWGVTTDITGKHLGALFGLMNSMGFFGGFLSQLFLGYFADWRGGQGYTGRDQWDPAFYVYAAVLVVGAGCWFLIDARQSAVKPRKGSAS